MATKLKITSTNFSVTLGNAFMRSLVTTGGPSTGVISFKVVKGSLPSGVAFSAGKFSGKPKKAGITKLSIEAKKGTEVATEEITITVKKPVVAGAKSTTTTSGKKTGKSGTGKGTGKSGTAAVVAPAVIDTSKVDEATRKLNEAAKRAEEATKAANASAAKPTPQPFHENYLWLAGIIAVVILALAMIFAFAPKADSASAPAAAAATTAPIVVAPTADNSNSGKGTGTMTAGTLDTGVFATNWNAYHNDSNVGTLETGLAQEWDIAAKNGTQMGPASDLAGWDVPAGTVLATDFNHLVIHKLDGSVAKFGVDIIVLKVGTDSSVCHNDASICQNGLYYIVNAIHSPTPGRGYTITFSQAELDALKANQPFPTK